MGGGGGGGSVVQSVLYRLVPRGVWALRFGIIGGRLVLGVVLGFLLNAALRNTHFFGCGFQGRF